MRVADVDRDDRQPLSGDVELLVRPTRRPRRAPAGRSRRLRRRRARTTPSRRVDLHVWRARLPEQPRGGDPGSVARHLRRRPVRVPDHERRPRPSRADDLQHAVARRSRCGRRRGARTRSGVSVAAVRLLDEEVRVAERMPLLEAHRLRLPAYVREDLCRDVAPARERRPRGRCRESAASTCAGTRRSVACGRRSARAPPRARARRSRAGPASSRPCARRGCASAARPPRRRRGRTSPRVRCRMRRSSSSRGDVEPDDQCRPSRRAAPRAGRCAASATARPRRARARARAAAGRSGGRSAAAPGSSAGEARVRGGAVAVDLLLDPLPHARASGRWHVEVGERRAEVQARSAGDDRDAVLARRARRSRRARARRTRRRSSPRRARGSRRGASAAPAGS